MTFYDRLEAIAFRAASIGNMELFRRVKAKQRQALKGSVFDPIRA